MTPEFANATLPLVVYILKLFDRATAYKTGSAESERSLLRAEFEATAAKLRGPRAEEWELASYALAAVVDELLIVDIPWTGQSWWEAFQYPSAGHRVLFEGRQGGVVSIQGSVVDVRARCPGRLQRRAPRPA